MSNYYCFLVTILYGHRLLQCALKIHHDCVSEDVCEYPMEPENREALHGFLAEHVRSCGPIVDVQDLFEVQIVEPPHA